MNTSNLNPKPVNLPGAQASSGTSSGALKLSYRDIDPLEEGGRTARDGFDYQDHVAVNKCLDMLLGTGPLEVWCEAEDDIVLVWSAHGQEEFEFVQVKGFNIKQAWTIAKLCARESGKDGKKKHSIVEKSLAHDRGREACRFRVVTQWLPDAVLNVLLLPVSARTDSTSVSALSDAASAIEGALGIIASPNGNGPSYWTAHTVWEHRATSLDVRNENLVKLVRWLDLIGEFLAPDQCDELHTNLHRRVQDASLAHGVTEKEKKRLRRDDLKSWLLGRVRAIQHPTHSGNTGPLQRKLIEAGVDATTIDLARTLRQRYVSEARAPKYLTVEDRESFEDEVLATLHGLKSRLDAGDISEDGKQFLVHCQTDLKALRTAMAGAKPSEAILFGYLYEVMNRCLHRLSRVST
jgi:hypothetical protein